MKKLLAVGVILLFIGMSISSTGFDAIEQSNIATSNDKTLYVGGSGPNNYTKIQDAINDSSDGDTVFVYNGTYIEDLIVNKSIYLFGENRNTTIIQCEEEIGFFFNVVADNVTICGFTINSGWPWSFQFDEVSDGTFFKNNINPAYGIGINLFNSERLNVSNNFLNGGKISILRGRNCVIENNIIANINGMNRQSSGIAIGYSKDITIIHNHISDWRKGIFIEESKSICILKNNFVNYIRSAKVWNSFVLWDSNYWGRARILPKPIFGMYYIIPIFKFDWHPASEPYDIEV